MPHMVMKARLNIVFIFLAAAEMFFLLLSCTTANAQAAAPDAAAVERGQGSYTSSCSFCHGAKATGSEQAPGLLRSRFVTQDHNGEVLGPFLKEGRPATGMPAFGSLSASDVSDIAAFLHASRLSSRSGGLPEVSPIVGDAGAGKAYFNGAGRCGTCHSPTGDLAGIASKLEPLVLAADFLTPPSQPVKAQVTLPSGKIVSGTLKFKDEFTIALVDSSGVFHSWQRSLVKKVDLTDPLAGHKALLPRYTDKEIHDLLAYLVTLK
jgi:cytochrome c oxidase cbb3-type subunit 3